MTPIAHTEIGVRIVPQKSLGRALATRRGSRMPTRASDQRRSTRPLRARQRGPHCTTFPGSIAASLARETRRRSPSVGNQLLPVRAEGTLLWINPCMFHERRTCLPWSTFHRARVVRPLRTWPALAFTRLRQRVHGVNTNMCRVLRLNKEQAASTRALVSCPTWRGVGYIGLCTCLVQRGRSAGRVSRAVKNTIRAAS